MSHPADSHAPPATRRHPGSVVALMVLLGLLVVGALQGGIAMVVDPYEPLGMSVEFLEGTPVGTYFWPGIFLLGTAAASLLTLAGLLTGWRWRWARGIERSVGYRWPWMGSVATGTVLLAFEVAEVFLIPFHPVMHPLLIAGSAALIALALTPSARAHLRARPRSARTGGP